MNSWESNYINKDNQGVTPKIVAYRYDHGNVRISVDYLSPVRIKSDAVNFMRPLVLAFGLVWVVAGFGVMLIHQGRIEGGYRPD